MKLLPFVTHLFYIKTHQNVRFLIFCTDKHFLVFKHIVGGPASGIPSRQEQADLLKNVEEVFNQVRVMVDDEGRLTDKAAIADLEKLIKREQDKLCLVEELALLSKYTSSKSYSRKSNGIVALQCVITAESC